MQILIEQTFCGYTVAPTNKKAVIAIAEYMQQWDSFPWENVYIESWAIEKDKDILRLTPQDLENLACGWNVTKNKIDAWEFLHLVGYDSHENVTW